MAQDCKTASENRLGVPRCTGFTVQDISDKYARAPGPLIEYGAALPYDEECTAKPAYTALSSEVNPRA
ncbi:endo-1,4-beta-xylanase [Streptomyces sp. NPDC059627]